MSHDSHGKKWDFLRGLIKMAPFGSLVETHEKGTYVERDFTVMDRHSEP
jgi:hypothetical protein